MSIFTSFLVIFIFYLFLFFILIIDWVKIFLSGVDAEDCIQKVQTLQYDEETGYGGLLVIKAVSSGLDIGTSNWKFKSPKKDVVFISSSVFVSAPALSFNYHALQNCDVVLFSDFSSLNSMEVDEMEIGDSAPM